MLASVGASPFDRVQRVDAGGLWLRCWLRAEPASGDEPLSYGDGRDPASIRGQSTGHLALIIWHEPWSGWAAIGARRSRMVVAARTMLASAGRTSSSRRVLRPRSGFT
jgi:hypothetical protein